MNSKRSFFFRILCLIFIPLLFFVSLELICRVWYKPGRAESKNIYEYDPQKVYRLKPSFNGATSGVPVRTNSFGYRSKEISVKKPSHTIRVLIIGDSISFGHGIPYEATYAEKLEQLLKQKHPELRFEVMNSAVPGNSAFQEYFDLERGIRLNPDIIFYQFVMNDVVEPYWVYRKFGGSGIDYHHIPDTAYYDYFLRQHSALYLLLRDAAARLKFKDPKGKNIEERAKRQEAYACENLVFKPQTHEILAAWNEYFVWANRIADLAKEKNIPLVLMATPFEFQFGLEEKMAIPQEKLKHFARIKKLPFIDLLKELQIEFKRKTGKNPWEASQQERVDFWRTYFLDGDHLNPQGHEITARMIFAIIDRAIDRALVVPF